MKVQGANSSSASTGKIKKKSGGGGGFAAALSEVGNESAAPVASTSGIASINPLFALQEVDNEGAGRRKELQRGRNMVEYLDEIRVGLLDGRISESLLRRLDGLVKQWRDDLNDPDLKEIIDEIELRAAVEVAKLSC